MTLGEDIVLDIEVPSAIPRMTCSRDRLRDAVIQLLANSREALPAGGSISIAVASKRHAPLSEVVELRIIDNGIGMDRETLRRASDPFFTTKSTGLGGLGLTIVSHFAQEIGGNFHLQSEFGIGTRATLVLPLRSRGEKRAL